MAWPVARLGDGSSHGGVITTVYATKTKVEGILVAKVNDLHTCPIPGHGVTAIVTGSPKFKCEGNDVARGDGSGGSVTGCGAVIIGGAVKTFCG